MNKPKCIVDGCLGEYSAKGLCSSCYHRWNYHRRSGMSMKDFLILRTKSLKTGIPIEVRPKKSDHVPCIIEGCTVNRVNPSTDRVSGAFGMCNTCKRVWRIHKKKVGLNLELFKVLRARFITDGRTTPITRYSEYPGNENEV